MFKQHAAWLIVIIMILAGCHGRGPAGEVQLNGDFSVRLVGSNSADAAANGDWRADGNTIEVFAHHADLAGFELSYDPAALHVASIERGDYFGPDDLYLAADNRPGLAAVGGYRFEQLAMTEPVLVARVILAAGPAGHVASALPTGGNARPRAFELTDTGDGTATLSWWHHNTGDYNQDGEVGLGDITPIGVYFNAAAGDADWNDAHLADGDNNGLVLASDLTPVGANFLTRISGYAIEQGAGADGPFSQVADVPLSAGTADPLLSFSHVLAAPQDGAYYRVRSYSSKDAAQGAATAALRFDLLPAGANPVAVASADTISGEAPLAVGFSDGGSTDSDGTIQLWEWDFDNDMEYEYDASTTGGLASHTFTESGTYYARLKVTDNDGRSATDVVMISVGGGGGTTGDPPTAYAYCLPNQGWAPLTVYFSPFDSTAAGTASITKYEWDLDGDGQYETDATTDNGYAQYTYNTAGTYTPRLRLTDSAGLTVTAAVSVNVRDMAQATVDYETIFDDSQVRQVLIDIDQADWDAMWVTPEDKLEVECQATVFGEQFSDVMISMRGHRSLWDVPEKKPWQLDFNDIDDTQEYHNLKQLLFNNFYQDPALVREKLAYDMLAFAGVSASHVCYVDFWIDVHGDGEPVVFYGVYSMVERVDKKFLENRYGVDYDDGNLYKASAWEEGSADLAYLGPNITDYPLPHGKDYCYGKRTNEDEADYSDVINLCYVIDGVEYATPEAFATALEQVFNVDSFLRYLACVISCSNLDIYIYTGNNYYLYNNPATGRFEWLPWDVNDSWGLFMDTEMNKNQPLYGLGEMPLTRRVMEVDKYRRAYAAYIDLLRRHWFTYENVRTQAQGIHDLISPNVKQDTGDKMFYGASAMFPIAAFDANWDTNYTQEPELNVLGVASLTQLRCDFIDAHLLADL